MNFTQVGFREYALVLDDGEIIDRIFGNHRYEFTVQSTGKTYIDLEKAKAAALSNIIKYKTTGG